MKRLISLWLAAMLLAANHAQAVNMVGFGFEDEDEEGEVDYCADKLTGGYSLYYDADYPDGATTACVSGDTETVTLTSTTPTISDTVNTTSGGTYGVLWTPTQNTYLNIPATGITPENGRIEFDLVFTDTAPTSSGMGILEWSTAASASLYVKLQQSGGNYRLAFYHYDGTTSYIGSNSGAYVALLPNTSNKVAVDWNSTTGQMVIVLGANTTTSTGQSVGAFTVPIKGVRFGEDIWSEIGNQPVGFDNIYMGPSQQ